MKECSVCASMPAVIHGKTVAEISEFAGRLSEISTDFKHWVTLFRCEVCGQEWEEYYEAKGHGDVPSVRKKS